jgi:hypothetical protein
MLFRGDLRVSRLLQRMDTHKRILLALSERNVPRVHALLLAELKDGSSHKAILAAVQEAVEGTRKPTGKKDEVKAATRSSRAVTLAPLPRLSCILLQFSHFSRS